MVLTPSPAEPPALPSPLFKLHLSDTKTRRSASLPKVEDTLSARMQLMLYHRLLSNLLASPAESEDALDFQQIWLRMRLDHRRPFSQTFRDTAGLVLLSNDTNGSAIALNCLDDLTEGWRNLVEALHLSGVDDTLTVVYRTQPKKTRWKNKRSHTPSSADLLATETDDIVRAVIASLDDSLAPACDEQMVEEGLKTMLAEVTSADEPTTSIPSPSPGLASGSGDDASLEWAIQQSLLEQVRSRPELKDIVLAGEAETSAPPSPKEKPIEDKERTPEPSESTVIGKKTFQMDEKTLLSYVKSVLDWWYGRRPPKGVDVHLAGRCL
ncbi:hypothetical protein EUX98_g5137 [Antrodiella citrinella]|uniref:Uncharacterized protein n=1 Tax=Antrodiella citrinella TaxID=2447956 RepID=A0A4S4MSB9_9APHY|nr:hypothetical protein EUX98_g5137 [Antrodiella citrinella]